MAHDRSESTPNDATRELERRLGLKETVGIVIAGIIGVGIFYNPAKVVARAGDGGWALLAWVTGGVMAVLGGLTFAELGAMFPRTGGQFVILRKAFGPEIGFAYVTSVMSTVNGGALGILALIGVNSLAAGVDRQLPEVWQAPAAIGLLAAVWLVNLAGVRVSAGFLNFNVLIKLVIIGGIIAVALVHGAPKGAAPAFGFAHAPGPGSFIYALIPVLFSVGGWQQGLWAAGEVKNPEKNLPRGLLLGVGIVLVAYIAVNIAYLVLLGPARMAQSSALAADAVGVVSDASSRIVALAVGFSALGTTHCIMFTGPRQIVALARDGLAPAALGRVSGRTGTPGPATTTLFVVAAGLVAWAGFDGVDKLLDAVVPVDWIFLGLTGLALPVFRKSLPDHPRPYRVPYYPLVPLVFVAFSALATGSAFYEEAGRIPGALAVGSVLTLALIGRFWIKKRSLP